MSEVEIKKSAQHTKKLNLLQILLTNQFQNSTPL